MPADPGAILPGRVVVAGGRAVHVVEQDGSGPPVLLLGGCGVPYYAWNAVAGLLAGRRLVRMDRPGLGGTPWPGSLPTLAEEVGTLADLLAAIGAPAQVVAHSMAGPHAEALVRQHPDRVRGLVLVDGSVESMPRASSDQERWNRGAERIRGLMRAVPASRPLGSLADRVMTAAQSSRLGVFAPRPDVQRTVYRSPDAVASVLAEQAAYHNQLAALAELRGVAAWPGTPTRVLTATLDGGAGWTRLQAGLAAELGAEHFLVAGSKHLMMFDRPDAIADAVRQLPG